MYYCINVSMLMSFSLCHLCEMHNQFTVVLCVECVVLRKIIALKSELSFWPNIWESTECIESLQSFDYSLRSLLYIFKASVYIWVSWRHLLTFLSTQFIERKLIGIEYLCLFVRAVGTINGYKSLISYDLKFYVIVHNVDLMK